MGQVLGSSKQRSSTTKTRQATGLTLVFSGVRQAGKTALIWRLKTGEFQADLSPTTSMHIDIVTLDGTDLTVLDSGGRCSVRPFFRMYKDHSQGLAFTIDASDAAGLEDAVDKLAFYSDSLPNMPIAVLCNKCDLLGDRQAAATFVADFQNKLQTEEKLTLAMGSRPHRCFAVSALTGEGVAQATTWLVQAALRYSAVAPPRAPTAALEKGDQSAGVRVAWTARLYRTMKAALTH